MENINNDRAIDALCVTIDEAMDHFNEIRDSGDSEEIAGALNHILGLTECLTMVMSTIYKN